MKSHSTRAGIRLPDSILASYHARSILEEAHKIWGERGVNPNAALNSLGMMKFGSAGPPAAAHKDSEAMKQNVMQHLHNDLAQGRTKIVSKYEPDEDDSVSAGGVEGGKRKRRRGKRVDNDSNDSDSRDDDDDDPRMYRGRMDDGMRIESVDRGNNNNFWRQVDN
jgi:hypothetical protein